MVAQPTVDLRDVRPEDHEHLRPIQNAAIDEPSPQLLRAAVDGLGIGLVAVSDRPVGYVFALVGETAAYVPEIAVDPAHQRRGIGTALLDGIAERTAKAGASALRVTVRVDDERARAFYRTHGFREHERLPEYYGTEPAAGVVLSRPL
ncbi:N-acetyltransferase [Halorhabdus sp. SVX81]|uniref:GNAT family N-acetyltransferase n=1 Tax=Halorhabdus sp. SVX81 TaxID=2978283 RepID=UPI0023DC3285|nr:N-acetyltransferase [Halorhabdus sp. SVX81]